MEMKEGGAICDSTSDLLRETIQDATRELDREDALSQIDGACEEKQCDVNIHQLAHAAEVDFAQGYKAVLHIAAKEILEVYRKIALPPAQMELTSSRKPLELAPARTGNLTSVQLKQRPGNIVPDVLVELCGKELLVEIRVTDEVDEAILEKIRARDIPAIEVDLSDLQNDVSLTELKSHVVDSSHRKVWLHNPLAREEHDNLLSAGRYIECIDRGNAGHIDGCPLSTRKWRGRRYADIIDDCLDCRYALAIGDGINSVTCAAFDDNCRERVDSLDSR